MAQENTNLQSQEDKAKKNIFAMTFEKQKQGKLEMKKKNLRKGYIFMAISVILLVSYSIAFLYPQAQSFLSFNQNMKGIEKQIGDYDITLADMNKTRDMHKAAYDEEFKDEQDIINKIFPANTEKLAVIRLMEDFATHLNTAYPPFEFTSITFQEPKKEGGYTVLPFQTSIQSSQINFERFLSLVNLSGKYDPKAEDHIRLMEISNITLRYKGVDKEGRDQGVSFDVQLNAYSR